MDNELTLELFGTSSTIMPESLEKPTLLGVGEKCCILGVLPKTYVDDIPAKSEVKTTDIMHAEIEYDCDEDCH